MVQFFLLLLPTKNDQEKPVLLSGFNLDIAHSSIFKYNLLQTFSEFHFTDPVSLFVILYAQILQRKKSLWDKIPAALFRCLKPSLREDSRTLHTRVHSRTQKTRKQEGEQSSWLKTFQNSISVRCHLLTRKGNLSMRVSSEIRSTSYSRRATFLACV